MSETAAEALRSLAAELEAAALEVPGTHGAHAYRNSADLARQRAAELGRERAQAAASGASTDAGGSRDVQGAGDGTEALSEPARVVYERLWALGCTVPVDPYDPEDCASVAEAAVGALCKAGLIREAGERDRLAILAPGERDALLRDLGQLLEALGLGDHARPQSPHEVMLMCIAEATRIRERLVAASSLLNEDRQ